MEILVLVLRHSVGNWSKIYSKCNVNKNTENTFRPYIIAIIHQHMRNLEVSDGLHIGLTSFIVRTGSHGDRSGI